ncbi:energy transducer TonB [Thioalkalivibrio sp. ALJ24]|uniref:energy transducer TonB n=1 Tax=Thioalkalivibrio sp. ALJ24 TaxID=545276 RepID=UPI00037B2981|nr:energy transducer TonB [Thioalkalivibrio sp. ALJ24]
MPAPQDQPDRPAPAPASEHTHARPNHFATMVFLALLAHGLVIMGIGFTVDMPEPTPREPMDVTRVTDPEARTPPEEVERIAEIDQDAGAEDPEDQEATAPEAAEEGTGEAEAEGVDAPLPEPGPLVAQPSPPEPEPEPDTIEAEDSPEPAPPEIAEPEPIESPEAEPRPDAATLMNRGLESARAAPAEERQSFSARGQRTRYLDSLSARSAPEAAYLQAWIDKVERVGNVNYPDEARRQGLSGSLVLSVRLNPEGELMDVQVARSSGEPVLDEAAIRIVELGAPYAPFTEAMREEYDELVITRTWAFRRDEVRQVR